MSFPNISDLAATTIENRSGEIADSVTKNNALLVRLEKKGKIRPFGGGTLILEELSFAENANFGWYSGYDLLPTAAQDVLSAAQFTIKQAATAVTINGLETLQNRGREEIIDLLEKRIGVAEATMKNNLASAIYSDGTGSGGKQLGGLALLVPVDPTTGTAGGINRSTWNFWRSVTQQAGGFTTANIQDYFNQLWSQLVRGKDRPDIMPVDNTLWSAYVGSLQAQQRFTNPDTAKLGFPSLQYMDMDVVLDGGIGGFAPAGSGWMLNSDYLFLRPHKDRNMVPLSPGRRVSVNQDAEVQIIAWAGNMTMSGGRFHGFMKGY